jgi:hypothetical protein
MSVWYRLRQALRDAQRLLPAPAAGCLKQSAYPNQKMAPRGASAMAAKRRVSPVQQVHEIFTACARNLYVFPVAVHRFASAGIFARRAMHGHGCCLP